MTVPQSPSSSRILNSVWFFLLVVIAYQMVFLFQGIDLSDEGFCAVFYQEIFQHPGSVEYNFMFWLSGIVGGVFLKLFPFAGLLGLRLLGLLTITLTVYMSYRLLRDHLNKTHLKLGLLLVLISQNNEIKIFSYNSFSALIYVLTIASLFWGVSRKRLLLIFIAGCLVALNSFVRIPNVMAVGLGALILAYPLLQGSFPMKTIIRQLIAFVAGFVSGFLLMILLLKILGHYDIFLNSIRILFSMGNETELAQMDQNSYGMWKLIKQFMYGNVTGILYLVIVLSYFLFASLVRTYIQKFRRLSDLIYFGLLFFAFGITVLGLWKGAIDKYFVIFLLTGFTLVVTFLILLSGVSVATKFLSLLGIYFLVTYPFASSDGIMTAGRNALWIGLPITLNYVLSLNGISFDISGDNTSGKLLQVSLKRSSLMRMWKPILAFVIIVDLFYAYRYPFFDWHDRRNMRYAVNSKRVAGIYTTKGRADVLNDFLAASANYIQPGDYVLAYDCMPMFHFLTNTTPFLHTSYPWLYQAHVFTRDLAESARERKVLPVVVTQKFQTIGDASTWPEKLLPGDYEMLDMNLQRNRTLQEFLKRNEYRIAWENSYFRIYIPSNSVFK